MQSWKQLIVIIGWACLMTFDCNADGYAPRIGEIHPDIVLPSLADREPVALSQFRGRKVLLVHMASW